MRSISMALALIGCATPGVEPGEPVPDFSLEDVNPSSPTGGQPVSPRDHIGVTSAWYFGHAT